MENEIKDIKNYHINYPSKNALFTRIIEHKHFEPHNKEFQKRKKELLVKNLVKKRIKQKKSILSN